jgi:polyisoprenoid-binding protein YceI
MTLALAASLLALAAAAEAPRYALDPAQTVVMCRTHKAGAASALAHDHAVRGTEVQGEIRYDPAQPEASAVEVTVQTGSLTVDQAEDRKRLGLEGGPDASDRAKIEEKMKDEGQLDVKKFPTIHFVSTAVKAEGDKLHVVGKLTLHGVTHEVSLPVSVKAEGGKVVGDGEVSLKTSDYGIEPFSAFLGAVKNKDQVELILHLVAKK